MNDCPNAEIRDQLPDLIHERLEVSMRAAVLAHVADCVDCREELELLRGVRAVLVTQAPRIDITHVVAALPKAPAQRRRRQMDWRIAAAVTFLAVGGSSVALLNRTTGVTVGNGVPPVAPVIGQATPLASSAANAVPANVAPANDSQARPAQVVASANEQAAADVSPGGRFADLNEGQLKALLGEIDKLQAVPVTEPEPVSIRVDAKSPAAPDAGGGGAAHDR
ncbi:MAG: hypothetical protein JWM41_2511 [Gemmatimonadetes bacterium]|nr:hypothetical protein [Gemmatimonadota bacterium]